MLSILDRTVREGFTQSELSLLSECPMKWHLRYNLLLQRPDSFSFALMVGTIIHDALEQIYKTGFERWNILPIEFPKGTIPALGDITKAEYWNAIIPQMMKAYVNYWKATDVKELKILELEEIISIEYKGFIIRGKVDMTLLKGKNKKPIVVDHKSSGKLNRETIVGFDFRFQFLFYLWLKWKKNPRILYYGYTANLIKKPELRQGKNESLEAFSVRVYSDMVENPEKYFYREMYHIDIATLQNFEKNIVDPKINKIRLGLTNPELFEVLFLDKNTNECQRLGQPPCEFIDICRHGFEEMKHLYITKNHKHEELNNEN